MVNEKMNNGIEEGGAECTLEKSNLFLMLSELMLKGQGGPRPKTYFMLFL